MVDGGAGHRRMVAGPRQAGIDGASGWWPTGAGWDAGGNGVTRQGRSNAAGHRLGRRGAPVWAGGRPRRPPCGRFSADGLGRGHIPCLDAADFRLGQRGDGARPRPTWWAADLGALLVAPRRGRIAEEEDEGDDGMGNDAARPVGVGRIFLYKKDIDTWVLLNSS